MHFLYYLGGQQNNAILFNSNTDSIVIGLKISRMIPFPNLYATYIYYILLKNTNKKSRQFNKKIEVVFIKTNHSLSNFQKKKKVSSKKKPPNRIIVIIVREYIHYYVIRFIVCNLYDKLYDNALIVIYMLKHVTHYTSVCLSVAEEQHVYYTKIILMA